MKTKLLHQISYPKGGRDAEKPQGVSATVPDMTPDFATMLRSGRSTQLLDHGYSDEEFPDLHQMDTMDILQMRIDNAQRIEELRAYEHQFAKELEDRHKPVTGDKPITSLDYNRLDDTKESAVTANTPKKKPSEEAYEE